MVVDERIDNQELQENETDTEDSAEIQRSEENEMEKLDEPIVPSGQALQRIQRQLFNGILERLGPTATQDPMNISILAEKLKTNSIATRSLQRMTIQKC